MLIFSVAVLVLTASCGNVDAVAARSDGTQEVQDTSNVVRPDPHEPVLAQDGRTPESTITPRPPPESATTSESTITPQPPPEPATTLSSAERPALGVFTGGSLTPKDR